MERLEAKKISGRIYYYYSKWAWVDGKCRRVWQKYLGTLENIAKAIPLCDEVRVLDNSSVSRPFLPVLTIKQGQRTIHMQPLPEWAKRF